MAWEEVGLGTQKGFASLNYNLTSSALVAQMYRNVDESTQLKSLWLRRPADQKYRSLSEPSDLLSFDSVAVSPSSPYLYCCVFRTIQSGSFDWDSFRVYDLNNCLIEYESTKIDFEKSYKHAWMSSVIDCTDDCHNVVCVIALELTTGRVEYWLCEYTWPSGVYSRITPLKRSFV